MGCLCRWDCSSNLGTRKWGGGQRHAPAALPPRKTRYPLYRRLGDPQGRSGREKKISPSTPRIRSPDGSAHSESLYSLRYPGRRMFRVYGAMCVCPVAARSKAWVCSHSIVGIEGSNPTWEMVFCLVNVVCCQVEVSAMGPSII